MAVYAGTKAFDLCFGEGLWAELRPHGVHVLNLILGRTNTPMFRAFMEKRGLPVGAGAAEPDDVAKLGLERLPHGPVQNWGAADDQPGFAPISAAARRERILKIEAASNNVFKAKLPASEVPENVRPWHQSHQYPHHRHRGLFAILCRRVRL
jgi:NAD(P)-dependent dehydrogenase (short-subunit alcohol dehydrogenase family)